MSPFAKKALGQHFLQDSSLLRVIIKKLNPDPNDLFIEIGPGKGALTQLIKGSEIHCVELDLQLLKSLQLQLPRANFYHADAACFDFAKILASNPNKRIKIVGNLPYNRGTDIILHILHNCKEYALSMLFMLQKEVVMRICASPKTRAYGRLTVAMQSKARVNLFGNTIYPEAFSPPPKVHSHLLTLDSVAANPVVHSMAFSNFLRLCFQYKRKTLHNNLTKHYDAASLSCLKKNIRAEELSVEDFLQLFLDLQPHVSDRQT